MSRLSQVAANARVADLVDALDLGSSAERREGSIPFSRTKVIFDWQRSAHQSKLFCYHRLVVRPAGFHPANRGSIPRGSSRFSSALAANVVRER